MLDYTSEGVADYVAGDDYIDETVDTLDAEIEDQPDYDDWSTDDGNIFRHHGTGRVVLDATDMTDEQASRAAGRIMRKEGFWPNVWFISDHGNVSVFQF